MSILDYLMSNKGTTQLQSVGSSNPTGSPYAIGTEGYNSLMNYGPQPSTQTDMFSREAMFGGKSSNGWVTGGASAIAGLTSAWTGLEQLKLSKRQAQLQEQAFSLNVNNQKKLIDNELENKYRRREAVAGTDISDSYGTLNQYVKERTVKGV